MKTQQSTRSECWGQTINTYSNGDPTVYQVWVLGSKYWQIQQWRPNSLPGLSAGVKILTHTAMETQQSTRSECWGQNINTYSNEDPTVYQVWVLGSKYWHIQQWRPNSLPGLSAGVKILTHTAMETQQSTRSECWGQNINTYSNEDPTVYQVWVLGSKY